jgi:metallo-beta-lactamase family protein
MQLNFLGGTANAAGAKVLVEHAGRRLLVDCGLAHGVKQQRQRNWLPLAVPAASIDAIVLTRADSGHAGLVPRLLDFGLRAPVYATPATVDLCRTLWTEAGRLQEEEAEHANRAGLGRHRPALPLYTERAALQALELLQPVPCDEAFEPVAGFELRLGRAGAALGNAHVHVACGDHSLLVAGDLGREDDPLVPAPASPPAADVIVVGAGAAGALRPRPDDRAARLGQVITYALARDGHVLAPATLFGSALSLLHDVRVLQERGMLPARLPIVIDSPLADALPALLARHAAQLRPQGRACARLLHGVRLVSSEAESAALVEASEPGLIIATQDMFTGGRALRHLRSLAPDPRHAIVLPGQQTAGTRGRMLADGARSVRANGQWIDVRAEVAHVEGYSWRADRADLLHWLARLPRAPRRVFATQGDPADCDLLRQAIEEHCGWASSVPQHLEMTCCS